MRTIWGAVAAGVVVCGATLTQNDSARIAELVAALNGNSVSLDSVLDPTLDREARVRQVSRFHKTPYELAVTLTGKPRVADGRLAAPVRVHFKNSTTELDADAEVRFVNRDGVLYIADYDFLAFPTSLIVVIIICSGVGILYACGVVLLRVRLARDGRLDKGANSIKIFIPVFWPALFRNVRTGVLT